LQVPEDLRTEQSRNGRTLELRAPVADAFQTERVATGTPTTLFHHGRINQSINQSLDGGD